MNNILAQNSDHEMPYLDDNEQFHLINTLDDHLLVENIHDQIQYRNIETIPTDYFSLFESRIEYLENRYRDNNDLKEKLVMVKANFYNKILKKFQEVYKFEFNLNDLNVLEQRNIFYSLYHFFILNNKENLVDFFFNFIKENAKGLSAQFKDRPMKEEIKQELSQYYIDETGMIICYYIFDVIKLIVNDSMVPLDIIRYILKDKLVDTSQILVYNMFFEDDRVKLSSDFPKIFYSIILHREDGFMNIIREVESLCMKIYMKRKEQENL